ncbi:LAQU0S02e00320g1_1 [Lachancea quebecensis]|uniref:LAQU0S02e00320g1_1 n=1 Tax=Lachancea quebecensis TaxID=1654605 RepID=A0A0P1KVW8_9SACH|nr:LAQU0S02e00320g1_1 [Lachancea quebecensis]
MCVEMLKMDHFESRNKSMTIGTINSCIEWAKSHGSVIDDKVEFRADANQGTYAVANAQIVEGSVLVTIPHQLLVTTALAEKHFGLKAPTESNPNALLQLFLSKMKFSSESCSEIAFFQPFMDVLPLTKDIHSPYFWSREELTALKGTELLIKIERNLKKLVKEWFDLITKVNAADDDDTEFYLQSSSNPQFQLSDYSGQSEDFTWHSFTAYLWSAYIVSSRAFPELILEHPDLKDINQAFLYPVVDFFNHHNGQKVQWQLNKDTNGVSFSSGDQIERGEEIFNNYGDKSNEELLLNYGFAMPNNENDLSTLTLRLPPGQLESLVSWDLVISDQNLAENSVNFVLTVDSPLPMSLVKLFGILSKLTSENFVTWRSVLEGTERLNAIIDQKLDFFKDATKLRVSLKSPIRSKSTKAYLAGQKRIFQESSDFIKKFQRKVVKDLKPVSFKSIFKADKPFVNTLTLTFGIMKYEDLLSKGFLQQALLLWIVRAYNMSSREGANLALPQFIIDCFEDVKSNMVIEKDDVQEYLAFYKSMFPQLSTKIPEIYGKGDWSIKNFIVAGTVIDRLVWILPASQEAFFLERKRYDLLS